MAVGVSTRHQPPAKQLLLTNPCRLLDLNACQQHYYDDKGAITIIQSPLASAAVTNGECLPEGSRGAFVPKIGKNKFQIQNLDEDSGLLLRTPNKHTLDLVSAAHLYTSSLFVCCKTKTTPRNGHHGSIHVCCCCSSSACGCRGACDGLQQCMERLYVAVLFESEAPHSLLDVAIHVQGMGRTPQLGWNSYVILSYHLMMMKSCDRDSVLTLLCL